MWKEVARFVSNTLLFCFEKKKFLHRIQVIPPPKQKQKLANTHTHKHWQQQKAIMSGREPRKKQKKPLSKALRKQVWEKCNGKEYVGKCQCCNAKLEVTSSWHGGHKVAEHRGGVTTLSNLVVLCATCNLSMGTKDFDTFKRENFSESNNCQIS